VDLAVDDPSKGAAVGLEHLPRTQVATARVTRTARSPSCWQTVQVIDGQGGPEQVTH
jgi:hypothetical protein